jgi:chromate transporter
MAVHPTRSELFIGFCRVGLSGFGGVLPWARRYLVERYRWLRADEFNALLGLCQILPGPNVMNLSIAVGHRFHGAVGAVLAPTGLMAAPMAIVLCLGLLYEHYGDLPGVQAMLRGISAVAAGLIFAMGVKMASGLRLRAMSLPLAAAVFFAIALWRLPMIWVVALFVPVGIALARRLNKEV